MKRFSRQLRFALPAAALAAFLSGCFSAKPYPGGDFAVACRAAETLLLRSRVFDQLTLVANRAVGHERQLMRLETAEREDLRRLGAADDPRFSWAHEAECFVEFLLPPESDPPAAPEARMEKIVRQLLKFEQAVAWARFDACRERPRGDRELEAVLMTLRISTSWPEDRIYEFDFATLPHPGKTPALRIAKRDANVCGIEALRATSALLSLAVRSPEPDKAAYENALARSRAARIALAGTYLAEAQARWKRDQSPAALAEWRIARARYDLEKNFPRL